MYAIDEQDRIALLQVSFQAFVHLVTDTVYHAADARLGIMLPINLVKDITDLLLCQTFCIEHSCQTVTFLLLVTQDGEDLRMEVAITVTGDTELEFTAMSIG